MAESRSHLISDGAAKKNETGKSPIIVGFNSRPRENPLDQSLRFGSSFFTNVIHENMLFLTHTDSVSLATWRTAMEELKGKRYTLTLTFDAKRISGIQYKPRKQWEKMRTVMFQLSTKYNFKYYMVPEKHESGIIHSHGVILFPLYKRSNWKIMKDRSMCMAKLSKEVGTQIQTHQIFDLYKPYDSVGYEGNIQTKKRNCTLARWHKYCHNTPAVWKDYGISSNEFRKKI